jgi:hypothetical protein
MSNLNIKRVVEYIRSLTTVYTPIVETVVNAIEAIEEQPPAGGGRIAIRVLRSQQIELDLDTALRDIVGFEFEDNGIGFTDEHRNSFDMLYTDLKIKQGGKGFGRFVCLKYFEDVLVDSTYEQHGAFKRRQFSMGKEYQIVVNESVTDATKSETGSIVTLQSIKGKIEKTLPTIARNIVEKLLPYFITSDYVCPEITLSEADGSEPIVLNQFVSNELASVVNEVPVPNGTFTLRSNDVDQTFTVRVFKFYYPGHQKSRISLVAHKREVTGESIDAYVPEFSDEFYERITVGDSEQERNYIVKAYVFGRFLDNNVELERGDFRFGKGRNLEFGISEQDIQSEAARIAMEAVGAEITTRQQRKRDRVASYVDNDAPWHKTTLAEVDFSDMPYNPTDEQIETRLQMAKFSRETHIKRRITSILTDSTSETLHRDVPEIVRAISDTSKSELIHYIALRRNILNLFKRSLELDPDGRYSSEGLVHDIVFPRKGDTDTISFDEHNLWIIDERLNFTTYLASDIALDRRQGERPDLLVYDRRVVFRGDNEASNPVTIFELKRPQRDDFVDPSKAEKEDPVDQVIRYVNNIKEGKYKTPEGRTILIADNTPFYGYVVCDLTAKVNKWLFDQKDFSPMPDGLGWFRWFGNINLYMEVLSWDKVLRDATMRNKIFFHKLGI